MSRRVDLWRAVATWQTTDPAATDVAARTRELLSDLENYETDELPYIDMLLRAARALSD